MMKVVGIIQARLGSTRLPNKMLLSLHGKPIIEWVIKRVQESKLLDDLIVAIPDNKENDLLEFYCKKYNSKVFRGQEEDVLNRFIGAAKKTKATHIVRICADNPLISPKEIDNLISFYKQEKCDYAYNHIPKNNMYPDGLGAEIVSFNLLNDINNLQLKQSQREHCLSYITDNPEKFIIKTFNPKEKNLWHPELKFDVDTFDDLVYLHTIKMNVLSDINEVINNETINFRSDS